MNDIIFYKKVFIYVLISGIIYNETPDAKQLNKKQRDAVKSFIAGINAAADEILDDEFKDY